MKKIEAVKSFPGIEKGDIFVYNENLNLYEYYEIDTEVGEDYERTSNVSISLSPNYIETNPDYFNIIEDEKVEYYSINDVEDIKETHDVLEHMNELANALHNNDMAPEEFESIKSALWTLEWVLGIIDDSPCEGDCANCENKCK
jgi:hypothetical protein